MASQVEEDKLWGTGITSEKIAKVFVQISKGDQRVLTTSDKTYKKHDAVWGKAAKELFGEKKNSERNRLLLFRFWTFNRKKVRDHFEEITAKKKKKPIAKFSVPVAEEGNDQWSGCFCEPFYQPLTQDNRIECSKCNRWLHPTCAGVLIEHFSEQDEFVCGICTGELQLPTVLDQPRSEGSQAAPSPNIDNRKEGPNVFIGNESDHDKRKSDESLLSVPSDNDDFVSKPKFDLGTTSISEPKGRIGFSTPKTKSHGVKQSKCRGSTSSSTKPPLMSTPRSSKGKTGTPKRSNHSSTVPSFADFIKLNREKLRPANTITPRKLLTSGKAMDLGKGNDGNLSSLIESGNHPKIVTPVKTQHIAEPDFTPSRTSADLTMSRDGIKDKIEPSVTPIVPDNERPKSNQQHGPLRDEIFDYISQNDCLSSADDLSSDTDSSDVELLDNTNKADVMKDSKTLQEETIAELDFSEMFKSRKPSVVEAHRKSDIPQNVTTVKDRQGFVVPSPSAKPELKTASKAKDDPHSTNTDETKSQRDNYSGSDDQADDQDETPVDTSNEKKAFFIHISISDLAKILKVKVDNDDDTKFFEVVGRHTEIFSQKFDLKNKVCVMSFKKKLVGNPNDLARPILTAYAICKNKTCSAKWRFSMFWPAEGADMVNIEVRMYAGEMLHFASKPASRLYTGVYKEKARQSLKSEMPAAVRLEACRNADMEAVLKGKHTTIKTVKTFQMIKEKMENENDLSPDVVDDTLLTRLQLETTFPDNDLPGYIREFQVYPAKIILYSGIQMDVLKLLQSRQPVTLCLDATGSLVKPLGEKYDDRRMLIYSVIAPFAVKGCSALTICEMVTTDNKHTSIYTWLYTFFHSFQKRCGITRPNYGIQKFEIDFSKPMLTSLVRLFAGQPLDIYLNMFWDYYINKNDATQALELFPIHVCRFHVLKAMKRKLMTVFGKTQIKNKTEVIELYMSWANKLVRCKDLYSFDRRIKDIGVIGLFMFNFQAVKKRIDEFHSPTVHDGTPWKQFVFQKQPKDGPFWMRTYFGQYAYSVFTFCAEKNVEMSGRAEKEGCAVNQFYSKKFNDYLCTYFLPYFPVISHMVFDACDIQTTDDTNNPIEGYFGLLKTNIYKNKRHQKLSRFVRRQADLIQGLCNATKANISLHKSTKTNHPPRKFADDGDINTENLTGSIHDGSDGTDTENENKKSDDESNACDRGNKSPISNVDDWDVKKMSGTPFKGKNYEPVSPEKQQEIFKKTVHRSTIPSAAKDFSDFVPLLSYGGVFEDLSLRLLNTCNIDTTLQCLLALNLQVPGVDHFLQEKGRINKKNESIAEAVTFAMYQNYNTAKTVWIRDVLRLKPNTDGNLGTFDLLNSEFNHAMQFVADLFPIRRIHRCSNSKCVGFSDPTVYGEVKSKVKRWENATFAALLRWSPRDFENAFNLAEPYDCPCFCGAGRITQHQFDFNDAPFIMYPLLHSHIRNFDERELPMRQKFRNETYNVFAYTCIVGEMHSHSANNDAEVLHYIVKFVIGNNKVVYDGLQRRPYIEKKSPGHKVTSVWLVPSVN